METKYFEYWVQRETMLNQELIPATVVICVKAANFGEAYNAAASTGETIELIREIDEEAYYILSGEVPDDEVGIEEVPADEVGIEEEPPTVETI